MLPCTLVRIAGCPTPNALLRIAGCPTPNALLRIAVCPTPNALQHGGDVSECKIKYRLIRTRGKGGVSLSDVLYVRRLVNIRNFKRNNSIMYMVYDVAFRLEKNES